jgi:hypothetical protein
MLKLGDRPFLSSGLKTTDHEQKLYGRRELISWKAADPAISD